MFCEESPLTITGKRGFFCTCYNYCTNVSIIVVAFTLNHARTKSQNWGCEQGICPAHTPNFGVLLRYDIV
jgi:hypothetical protein